MFSLISLVSAGIEEWSEVAGKEKKTDTLRLPPEGLEETMKRDFQDKASTVEPPPPM